MATKKNWFQHDSNCRQKDGLSQLLALGGPEAYGRFWILQELFMQSVNHREKPKNFFETTESILYAELRLKKKTLRKFLQLISETCQVNSQLIPRTFPTRSQHVPNSFPTRSQLVPNMFPTRSGNKVRITLPNALIYMNKRFQKNDNKNKSKSKSKKERESTALSFSDFFNKKTGRSFKPEDILKYTNRLLSKKYSLPDCEKVTTYLCDLWLNDSKMKQHLKPSTIFGPKFSEYLELSKGESPAGTNIQKWSRRDKNSNA